MKPHLASEAIKAVSVRLEGPNTAALRPRLRAMNNLHGCGLVVFVPAERSCRAEHAWLVPCASGPPLYALDATSQALTPSLQTLNVASSAERRQAGLDAAKGLEQVREDACGRTSGGKAQVWPHLP